MVEFNLGRGRSTAVVSFTEESAGTGVDDDKSYVYQLFSCPVGIVDDTDCCELEDRDRMGFRKALWLFLNFIVLVWAAALLCNTVSSAVLVVMFVIVDWHAWIAMDAGDIWLISAIVER
jgi:hypothetical protein